MNFKKIALVVAMASSFAAHADVDMTDTSALTGAGAVAAAQELVLPELVNTPEGNVAYVIQEGDAVVSPAGNVAYVSQEGSGNYAAVLQQGIGALAYVVQIGADGNRAVLISKDPNNQTAREEGLGEGTDVSALAEAEILGAVLSSVGGNVQLLSQTSDGAGNTAYMYAEGTNNFAAIVQNATAAANLAIISQLGDGNRAFIKQQ
ncbi:MAG: hypothetical protein CFE39_04275 [Comamonadaceae bacterium PBBC2]|nr:MAG: hypothetical protein CFE39_04275 [Comamonadaceae bacterium PBBC2]